MGCETCKSRELCGVMYTESLRSWREGHNGDDSEFHGGLCTGVTGYVNMDWRTAHTTAPRGTKCTSQVVEEWKSRRLRWPHGVQGSWSDEEIVSYLNQNRSVWDLVRSDPEQIDRGLARRKYGLNRDQYEALMMFYCQHKSHRDISTVLGISESASWMLLHRAVRRLKQWRLTNEKTR